ncbi:hypothetical protein D3C78_1032260 [compost metagenome]
MNANPTIRIQNLGTASLSFCEISMLTAVLPVTISSTCSRSIILGAISLIAWTSSEVLTSDGPVAGIILIKASVPEGPGIAGEIVPMLGNASRSFNVLVTPAIRSVFPYDFARTTRGL